MSCGRTSTSGFHSAGSSGSSDGECPCYQRVSLAKQPRRGLHWTLGFGSEQDRKTCVPIARRKEGWALQFPLQLSWAAKVPLPAFYPLRRPGVGATVIRRRWGVEGRGGEAMRAGSSKDDRAGGIVVATTTMTHPSSPSRSPKRGRRPQSERQSLC